MSLQTCSLLTTDTPPDLGPGPRPGVRSEAVLNAELARFFQQQKVSPPKQALIKALALLWHDHLDAAHTLAQNIDSPDGAFLHGIMHRREPDYGNAAYWFRRVGRHAAFAELSRQAGPMFAAANSTILEQEVLPRGEWDPFAFINVCERVSGRPQSDAERRLVRELQRLESLVLFDHLTDG